METMEPVRIVLGWGAGRREVTVRLGGFDATVGELAEALGWPAADLAIDGRMVAAATPSWSRDCDGAR